ncbi:efflux RND transporter periplasmic adaptor subunit [Legionella parisiensis]|uniref:p-hydroxybenzoic acid efflux pump subunit AaeA n=1 Tax=Legionella parisiensis TaxID=45071 RepID=A0A1E5JTR6_9GAMM|nr:efflux RND transporter periplasmic adaptor subunit [Legionella parisiensis]KTD40749.1 hemolysin D [Legionella parisiensis]OEH47916.1 p-hydroxybenzoic acid efflux pump subunit AaeA [Legionella parisiensis]STX76802.1 hemolysin D [Legionella parisiensis]
MRLQNISRFKYWPQMAVLTLLLAGYVAYRYFAFYDTRSSDAYVSAHVVNMATMVSGPVTKIYVKDNQRVKKGDKLIEIDSLPFAYAVEQAKSKLEIAQLNYENEKADVAKAKLEIAHANFELDKENYRLNHTILVSPADGYITNFNLRVGQYITEGEGLFALIETKKWWVVTRYRETALRLIQPGDKAKIMIDMYPGKVFHGHVDSIGWGINRVQSGDVAPSTLVYLEATEDWIRMAQRFPVKIYIDDLTDEYPMRIGANATTITYR